MKPRGERPSSSEPSLQTSHGAGGGAISSRRKSGELTTKVRWFLGLFFSVFFLVGVFGTYALGIRPLLDVRAAQSWPEVRARIVSSDVERHTGDSTTYSVAISYTYRMNGKTYTGDQYDFTTGSSSGREDKAEIAARYRVGQSVPCYVNPENPAESVLERKKLRDWGFGFIPLVFALIGGGGICFAVFGQRKKTGMTSPETLRGAGASSFNRGASAVADSSDDGEADADDFARGAIELKPMQSRVGVIVATGLFALFWNGIVSVFLVNIIGDAMRGGAIMWVFLVFLLPFVGIGLFMIGLVVRQIMALANPVPRVTVNRSAFAPGETVELSWRFEGKTARLKQVKIFLEGREEATYRRGTDTKTDKEVFATFEIAEATGLSAGQPGEGKLRLPERTMHSFKSDNNRVVWVLRVKGAIAWWPDIDQEFNFHVRASAGRAAAFTPPPASES